MGKAPRNRLTVYNAVKIENPINLAIDPTAVFGYDDHRFQRSDAQPLDFNIKI